jgi:hypothetical protein
VPSEEAVTLTLMEQVLSPATVIPEKESEVWPTVKEGGEGLPQPV